MFRFKKLICIIIAVFIAITFSACKIEEKNEEGNGFPPKNEMEAYGFEYVMPANYEEEGKYHITLWRISFNVKMSVEEYNNYILALYDSFVSGNPYVYIGTEIKVSGTAWFYNYTIMLTDKPQMDETAKSYKYYFGEKISEYNVLQNCRYFKSTYSINSTTAEFIFGKPDFSMAVYVEERN